MRTLSLCCDERRARERSGSDGPPRHTQSACHIALCMDHPQLSRRRRRRVYRERAISYHACVTVIMVFFSQFSWRTSLAVMPRSESAFTNSCGCRVFPVTSVSQILCQDREREFRAEETRFNCPEPLAPRDHQLKISAFIIQ